jgi:hypothetical protein
MQSFWVTVNYDKEMVLSNCFTTRTREEAVDCMLNYLKLEFELSETAKVKVNHH